MNKWKSRIILLVMPLVLCFGCSPESSTSGTYEPDVAVTTTLDPISSRYQSLGYNETSTVWWQYLHEGDSDYIECSYGKCATIVVVPKKGCSSIYVEANFMNASGTIVGMGNDIASSIGAGERAVMQMNDTSDSGTKVKVTTIKCY